MSDMSKSTIESGPVGPRAGSWEDDEPGGDCSACKGFGGGEDWREVWFDCPVCDGSGVAL